MLSRAHLPETQEKSSEEEINYHVHQVISNFPATESKLEEIRKETNDDEQLQDIKQLILSGWPELRSRVKESVREY